MTLLRRCSTAALPLLLAAPLAAQTNPDPLRWVPADAEFVACVDWRALVDSQLFQDVLKAKTTPQQLDAALGIVKNLTGSNLLTDLDRGVVWGRIGDDNSVTVVVEGRFEPEKLVTIIKANKDYRADNLAGLDFHHWHDDKDGKDKFGAFLDSGTLVLSGAAQNLVDARDTATTAGGFLRTPLAGLLPARGSATAYALITRPERALPAGVMDDTLQARAALLTMTMKPQDLALGLVVHADNDDAANKWMQMAQGGRALLTLQTKNANAAMIAQDIVIARGEGASTTVSLSLPNQLVFETVNKAE